MCWCNFSLFIPLYYSFVFLYAFPIIFNSFIQQVFPESQLPARQCAGGGAWSGVLVARISCYTVKQEQSGFLDRVSQCTSHQKKASSLNTEPWAVLAPFRLWPSCPHFWQSVFLTVKFSAIQYKPTANRCRSENSSLAKDIRFHGID